jgi:hypothetical protein
MRKAEFFKMVEYVVGPAAIARGWVPGREGLFVRDEGDIILGFQVGGPFRTLDRDSLKVALAARMSITSRRLNDSNLAFSQQRPVKSAKTHVRLAMGCSFYELSRVAFQMENAAAGERIAVEGSGWSAVGAALAEKCTDEADKIMEKYGSIEKIREFYEDLYRNGDQAGARHVLMCINMMLDNYEEALKYISEARRNLNLFPPDEDYTIWGYAERHARKMLNAKLSHTIH